jgi:hypothetical protein
MSGPPAISFVVVVLNDYSSISRVVRHLRAQTIRSRIELVIVAPSAESIASCTDAEISGFSSVRKLYVGTIDDREVASVQGIQASAAPIVALNEDHAYPEPEFSERLVEAHAGPYAAVGPAVLNGNPGFLSWTNMLLSYGGWPPTMKRGELTDIALHNSSFKRDVLLSYGDQLAHLLSRSGGLLRKLREDGHKFLFEPSARIHHVNPSTPGATLQLRLKAGRLYAASRASSEKWSLVKRLIYTAASPMIPAVRIAGSRWALFGGRRGKDALPFVPPLMIGLLLDTVGQAIGYAVGPGNTADVLARFEFVRRQHVSARDRELYL